MQEIHSTHSSTASLLAAGRENVVETNKLTFRRWARIVELQRRHEAAEVDRDPDDHFATTARENTCMTVCEAWGLGDAHARHQINVALFLHEHLQHVWELVAVGALDEFRAMTIADIARHQLDTPDQWRALAMRLQPFLLRHLTEFPDLDVRLVTCTVRQLRNKLNYVARCLSRARTDDRFATSYADRRTSVTEFDDAMAHLGITTTVDQARLAQHRLRLTARELRKRGDGRTIEQLTSDLAIDLLTGRGEGLPVPAYARPIINVSVPMETLAGVANTPGTLSGGTVIPAALARAIATSEGATWHRLLTDDEGEPVSLSTRSYQPTEPIWRTVVALQQTCAHRACDRPSTQTELDHIEPWPSGHTQALNLEPLCKRHHKRKHDLARSQPLRADLSSGSTQRRRETQTTRKSRMTGPNASRYTSAFSYACSAPMCRAIPEAPLTGPSPDGRVRVPP